LQKILNITPVLDKIQEYRRNWLQNINRMPRNRLLRIKESTDQRAEGIRGDHYRYLRTCVTGMDQQGAELHVSQMAVKVIKLK
jgi:hypothetical protein